MKRQPDREDRPKKAREDAPEPYDPPELEVLGTITELTRALADPGTDNNPGTPNGSTF